jgi:N-acetylglucosamine malate deacetylase 1
METLLVGLAHPDDEVGVAGTLLAQRARGDRVVIVWLTRGEMTEAFGPIPAAEVARKRTEQGMRAGELLGVETRFLDFPDSALVADRESAVRVAQVICDIRPTGLITWGEAWVRGMRHPDHQACGKIFRDAVNLARLAKIVAPAAPHRDDLPIFTIRDVYSTLPTIAVDVTPHRERIAGVADFYMHGVGFGDPAWMEHRLSDSGARWGCRYAEELDAWETQAGRLVAALLPAPLAEHTYHPTTRR